MLLESFVRDLKQEDKTGVFIAKISRLTGTLTYACLCFCELLDSVSRSAALLLAFVAYLTMVKNPIIQNSTVIPNLHSVIQHIYIIYRLHTEPTDLIQCSP